MLKAALEKGQEICKSLQDILSTHEKRSKTKKIGLQRVQQSEYEKRGEWKTDASVRQQALEWAKGLHQFEYVNTLKNTRGENCAYVMAMFEDVGVLEELKVDKSRLEEFISRASLCYRDVPYHNWSHATDVTQTVYSIIAGANARKVLTPLDVFSLLISAVVHDIDHNGVNNVLHQNVHSVLAMRYNDKSCLENHHCASAFALLRADEANAVKDFSRDDFNAFRERVIGCVLGTDMARHKEYMGRLEAFKQRLDGKTTEDLTPDDLEVGERELLMEVALKVSDISNIVKPFDVSVEWAKRVVTEFFTQGDEEKRRSLPVSPMFDREVEDPLKGQFGFINFLAGPIFKGLADVVPGMAPLIARIDGTIEGWEKVKEETERTSKPVFGPYDPFAVQFHEEM
mmetsp:Transcript_15696/g.39894  ORF Transcript_15696/g.39894 Transcript_15696/m.39894 type:complete len:399 (-) Transcript_15696:52-1248(-)